MTIAALGLAVDSSSVVAASPALEKMTAASRGAEAAAVRLGAASRTEAVGTTTATAAAKMHTMALQAQAAASRMAANDTRMLGFQINDIVVSLASGMNPAMVALQQGSQITQMGLRNVGNAALSMARGFAPAIAAVAALGVGVAAVTTELNRGQKQQVEWTDVVVASWQLASERLVTFFQPVIDMVGGWWNSVSPSIASGVNSLIGMFDLAFMDIKTIWDHLPAALGDVAFQAANNVVTAVNDMLARSKAQIYDFLRLASAALTPFGQGQNLANAAYAILGMHVGGGGVSNPFEGASANYSRELAQNRLDVAGTDYLGLIGARARQIAASSGLDDDKKNEKAAKGIRAITDEFGKLEDKVYGLRDAATDLFGDMGSTLANAFRKGGNVALNILNAIVERIGNIGESLMNSGFNQLLNMGLNALTGALTGSAAGFTYGPNTFFDPWGGFRAGGGDVQAGKAYIVGEQRPELFVPKTDGFILPRVPSFANQNAPAAANGNSGGGDIVMHISVNANSREGGAAAAAAFATGMRRWKASGEGAAFVRDVINRPGRANPR